MRNTESAFVARGSFLCLLVCLKSVYAGNDFQRLSDAFATVSKDFNECFRIIITDDNDSEETEQFTISFLVDFVDPVTISTTRITSDPNITTIFIQDNDG